MNGENVTFLLINIVVLKLVALHIMNNLNHQIMIIRGPKVGIAHSSLMIILMMDIYFLRVEKYGWRAFQLTWLTG